MYVLWKTKKLWQNGTYFSAHPRSSYSIAYLRYNRAEIVIYIWF